MCSFVVVRGSDLAGTPEMVEDRIWELLLSNIVTVQICLFYKLGQVWVPTLESTGAFSSGKMPTRINIGTGNK